MAIALVLVSIAFLVSLGMQLFGPRAAPKTTAKALPRDDGADVRAQSSAAELEKKKKELDESRAALTEVKAQLKEAKRKLYEQKEADKTGNDLAKARAEVERSASQQLEIVRAELAAALAEVSKLKTEAEARGGRRAPAPAAAAESKPAEPPPQRVIRELSDADKEKMTRLEQQSAKDRAKAGELEREVKRLKGRVETEKRVYTVTRGELDLVKDKFRALEKRLNRTLLERDVLKRALSDLEKKAGITAEKKELTAEELAASDKEVDQRAAAEAAEARAREDKARAEGEAAAATAEQTPAAPTPAPTNGAGS